MPYLANVFRPKRRTIDRLLTGKVAAMHYNTDTKVLVARFESSSAAAAAVRSGGAEWD